MSLNESIEKHIESSIHDVPNGYDLNFRFLEQTTEVVSDKHLKTLFETGDKPNGVDFELLINSKVHKDDFNKAGVEIQETITNLANDLYTAIDNVDEELSFGLNAHISNEDVHFTPEERIDVAKIPNLETAISNLNSIVGGVSRQHIVSSIEEMESLTELINADICHVVDTRETYIYDLATTTWIKVSDFDSLATVEWSIIQNIPTEFNPTSHIHTIDDVDQLRELIESAVGGDFSKYATKEELNNYSLKEDLNGYVSKSGDSINGNLNITEGNSIYVGDIKSDKWSALVARRYLYEKQLEAKVGVGGYNYVGYAQLGLHEISEDGTDTLINRLLLNSSNVFTSTTSNLGTPTNQWNDFYVKRIYSEGLVTIKGTTALENSSLIIDTSTDGNAYGDGRTHIGFKDSSGNYGHIIRGNGTTSIVTPKTTTRNLETATLKIGGRQLTLSSIAPTSPSVGDIWIQI